MLWSMMISLLLYNFLIVDFVDCFSQVAPSDAVVAAMSHYSSKMISEPENPAVYVHLAIALRFSGHYEQAVNVMEKGIQSAANYDSFDVRCTLGNLHRMQGRYSAALKHYMQAIQMDFLNQRGYHLVGMALQQERNLQASCRFYRVASRLSSVLEAEWHVSRLLYISAMLEMNKQPDDIIAKYGEVLGCGSQRGFVNSLVWSGMLHRLHIDSKLKTQIENYKENNMMLLKEQLQRELQQQQYNDGADCSNQRAVILSFGETIFGLGANLHLLTLALSYAYMENRMLIPLEKDSWWLADPNKCPDRSWNCYFEKLSSCSPSDLQVRPDEDIYINIGRQSRVVFINATSESFLRSVHPRGFVPKAYRTLGPMWWRSQLLQFLFKPKPEIIKQVKMTLGQLGLSQNVIGVHIRHGDKIQEEALPVPLHDYVQMVAGKVAKELSAETVFLASDSDKAASDFSELMSAKGFKIVTNNEELKSPHLAFKLLEFTHKVDLYQYVVEAITNIMALAQCQALVVTFSSNFGRVAAELKIASLNYHRNDNEKLTVISMDVPWHADP